MYFPIKYTSIEMAHTKSLPPYPQARWEPLYSPIEECLKDTKAGEYQSYHFPITYIDGLLFNAIKNMGRYDVGYENGILFLNWELYVPEDQQAGLAKAWMQFDSMDLCHFYGKNITELNLHGKPSPYNFEMKLWDLMHLEESITDQIIFYGKQIWEMTILSYVPFKKIALFRHKRGHLLELTFHWHKETDSTPILKKGEYYLKLMVKRL